MVTFIGIFTAIIIIFLLLMLYRFIWWRKESLRRLNGSSQVAVTERGKVEYACIGDGPVVLSLHGGLGGWDQGVVIAQNWLDLVKHGFTVLSPSRPGYLRTPIETGKTPEAAADAIAALLDILKIKKVLVLGTSGGGATALQFALRHPNYIQALVMLSTISERHVQPGRTRKRYTWFLFSKYGALLLDIGWWIIIGMVKHFPRLMIKSIFNATTTKDFSTREELDYVMTHPKALAGIQDLMQTQFPLSVRKVGLDNDLETYAHLPVYPIEQITCPTLVVHGRLDGNVPFSHSEFVSGTIPNAEMYVVENGGHLVSTGSESEPMQSAIIKFLKENSEKNLTC